MIYDRTTGSSHIANVFHYSYHEKRIQSTGIYLTRVYFLDEIEVQDVTMPRVTHASEHDRCSVIKLEPSCQLHKKYIANESCESTRLLSNSVILECCLMQSGVYLERAGSSTNFEDLDATIIGKTFSCKWYTLSSEFSSGRNAMSKKLVPMKKIQ